MGHRGRELGKIIKAAQPQRQDRSKGELIRRAKLAADMEKTAILLRLR